MRSSCVRRLQLAPRYRLIIDVAPSVAPSHAFQGTAANSGNIGITRVANSSPWCSNLGTRTLSRPRSQSTQSHVNAGVRLGIASRTRGLARTVTAIRCQDRWQVPSRRLREIVSNRATDLPLLGYWSSVRYSFGANRKFAMAARGRYAPYWTSALNWDPPRH